MHGYVIGVMLVVMWYASMKHLYSYYVCNEIHLQIAIPSLAGQATVSLYGDGKGSGGILLTTNVVWLMKL